MKTRRAYLVGVCLCVGMALAPPPDAAAQAAPVPSPWVAADVGAPAQPGSTTFDQDTFALQSSSAGLKSTADQFHFVYQQLTGNFDLAARVDSLTSGQPAARAGVMIRADLTPGSMSASNTISVGSGVAFQRRSSTGGTVRTTWSAAAAAPLWVRLTRAGSSVTAYSSADGGTWQRIGGATVPFGATVYAGLAVTSQDATATAQASVSQLALMTSALPTGQQAADIGAPALAGSASYLDGTYTIAAGGSDIWNTSDQFHFVYQQVSGDVAIVARVASLQAINTWSKAGVMVRESLDANARHAMALVTGAAGRMFEWRLDPGLDSRSGPMSSGGAPVWVRLVRTGSTFEAYQSADGAAWTSMGTQIVAMADTVYVGLAVTSHDESQSTTAILDHVQLGQAAKAPNQSPTVTLTAPASAAQFTAPATITVSADAADPEGGLARVEFFANATRIGTATAAPFSMTWSGVAAGTYSVTATAFDGDGASATSAAVTIDVQPSPPPPPPPSQGAPRYVVFNASADHDISVLSYRLDVFASGADPATATPLATVDLGKPTPDASTGEITVDEQAFFGALNAGSYLATVAAVGTTGESKSTAIAFTR